MISLVALVGAGGSIGPVDALPVCVDRRDQNFLSEKARNLLSGGMIIFGSNTVRMMEAAGQRLLDTDEHQYATWSRRLCLSPAAFLYELETLGRPLFICGGRRTFQLFAPFCESFTLWRTDLRTVPGTPDNTLDPILPNWQNIDENRGRLN